MKNTTDSAVKDRSIPIEAGRLCKICGTRTPILRRNEDIVVGTKDQENSVPVSSALAAFINPINLNVSGSIRWPGRLGLTQ